MQPHRRFLAMLSRHGSPARATLKLKRLRHTEPESLANIDVRSEDIKFSPSGERLAVVATNGVMYIFSVDTTASPVQVKDCAELHSTSLKSPHGVAFLGEDVVAVANRASNITFYRIPDAQYRGGRLKLEPVHELNSDWFGGAGKERSLRGRVVNTGPGSARIHGRELYVCCNYKNTVTAHTFELSEGRIKTGPERMVARGDIEIPDGMAFSPDGRWMAVSDHDNKRVLLYELGDPEPCGELRDPGLRHPHGLCFDLSGQRLFVADAGARRVHVFVSPGSWRMNSVTSTHSKVAVSALNFWRARRGTPPKHRPLEGGAKGIDIAPSGNILVTTSRFQLLRFFEIDPA